MLCVSRLCSVNLHFRTSLFFWSPRAHLLHALDTPLGHPHHSAHILDRFTSRHLHLSLLHSGLCTCILCLEGSALRGGYCHDCDIPPSPVHPQSRLHAALFALNSPHPNPIHTQTLSPPVLAFACTLQHLRCLCKRARRAAIPLRLAQTSLTNREHSRPNANHGTRSEARAIFVPLLYSFRLL